MRTLITMLAVAAGFLAVPVAANAADGFVTGDVNLRAGPSTSYPRITVLPEGAPVEIYGCLSTNTWCDVSSYGDRGWVSSRYLSIFYDGPSYVYRPRYVVPSVSFSFDYWDRWYYNRPWYRDYRRPPREERIVRPPVYRDDRPERLPREERIYRPHVFRADPGVERIERPRNDRPRFERNERVERRVPGGAGSGECRPDQVGCPPYVEEFGGGGGGGGGGNGRNR